MGSSRVPEWWFFILRTHTPCLSSTLVNEAEALPGGAAPDTPKRRGPVLWVVVLLIVPAAAIGLILGLRASKFELAPLPLHSMTAEQLAAEKTRQEILDLQQRHTFAGSLPTYAALATAFVAIIGLVFTANQQRTDRRRQHLSDVEERRRALEERSQESLRRFDANFNTAMMNLGNDSAAVQASAAVSMLTFLKEEYGRFHDQVFMVVLANLKVAHDDAINAILVRAFERALPLRLASVQSDERPLVLDLSWARMPRLHLIGQNLTDAQLSNADLSRANLERCTLHRVHGEGATLTEGRFPKTDLEEATFQGAHGDRPNFNDARLVSTKLQGAVLPGARFQGAKLQGAHLERSTLVGARFEGARLQDAYLQDAILSGAQFQGANLQGAHLERSTVVGTRFEGARLEGAHFLGVNLDGPAKLSLIRANRWQEANLDEGLKAELIALHDQGRAGPPHIKNGA